MPLDPLDNPLVLPLLGLLVEQPAHAYALTQRLAGRYPHLEVRRSSVTTLVGSLAAAGLIAPQRPRRVARRPPRVPYALTEAGYAHVRARVSADILEGRSGSTRLTLALSYLGMLPRAAAANALRRRVRLLARQLEAASVLPSLPEFQMLEVAYWQVLVRAEVAWMEDLQTRLADGTIEWPKHQPAAERRSR